MHRFVCVFALLTAAAGAASAAGGCSKDATSIGPELTSSTTTSSGALASASAAASTGSGGMAGAGGSGGQAASSSSGAGGEGGAGGSGCSAAAQCGAPAACGAWATLQQIAMDAPAPMGGSIVEGTYELGAHNVYTGPGGASGPFADQRQNRITLALNSGAYLLTNASMSQGGPMSIVLEGGGYTASMGMLALNGTCPSPSTLSLAYTATGGALSLYVPNGSTVDELVLAKK